MLGRGGRWRRGRVFGCGVTVGAAFAAAHGYAPLSLRDGCKAGSCVGWAAEKGTQPFVAKPPKSCGTRRFARGKCGLDGMRDGVARLWGAAGDLHVGVVVVKLFQQDGQVSLAAGGGRRIGFYGAGGGGSVILIDAIAAAGFAFAGGLPPHYSRLHRADDRRGVLAGERGTGNEHSPEFGWA